MKFPRINPHPAWQWIPLLYLLLLAVPGRSPLHAQLSTAYEEPDLTTPVFDLSRLGMEPPVRSTLATVLAAGVTYYNASLDAKILGIALRLDPGNRAAKQAAETRRKGELPDSREIGGGAPAYPTATVVSYLTGQSAGLRAKGGTDNLALAGYLSTIAADLDPHNPAAKYEKAAANPGAGPAWTFLKGKQTTAPETLPLLKQQSKIRGLAISELANGERTGEVLEIIVTAEEAHDRQSLGVTTARPVGDSMRVALGEAERAVKLRHPSFGAGQHFVLSFGEKYSGKDGPSAGAAFTLVLYSLYDPLRLAADCAITGDITVDGRIRAVGGVPSKIHGALIDGCRIVAIPKENASAVGDLPILYPANTLWKVQIFTVDTLDEALTVMREDRPADLQKAVDLFAAVQRKMGTETLGLSAVHADLMPQLREILRLAPGHASAAMMLKQLEGHPPTTLSLKASWDEVARITQAAMVAAIPKQPPQGLDQAALAAGISRLEALTPKLDYRVVELCTAALAELRAMQNVRITTTISPQYQEYARCRDATKEIEGRMFGNPALMEAMRH